MGNRSGGNRKNGWLAAGLACALLAVGGCDSDDGGTDGPPATASVSAPVATESPTGSPPPAETTEDQALAAYRGLWDVWVEIAETSDYESPLPAQYASGPALSLVHRAVWTSWRNGVVTRGQPVLDPRVTAADPAGSPDRVTVVDCVDTTNWLNYRPDGQLENDVPGGRSSVQALVLLIDGTWKVDQLVVQDKGTC